jgi:cellulose synthase/poly-beta-1,6-N-acetylglucosamine synthase-like glycosyltransferase
MLLSTVFNISLIFGINFLLRYLFDSCLFYLSGVIIMLIIFNNHYFQFNLKKSHKKNDFQPFFSLLVCAKNEEDNITTCINNLDQIEYPKDKYEIIIINDNSTDQTLSILQQIELPSNVKIVDRKRKDGFVSGVLNDGMEKISENSEIIGIVDSDCLVSPFILQKIAPEFYQFSGGLQILEWHTNTVSMIPKWLHLLCIHENYSSIERPNFKVGNFFNRENYIKYHEDSIIEDYQFSENLYNLGEKIKILQETLIYRCFPENIKKCYSQQYRYSLGKQLINYKKSFFQPDILIPQLLLGELILTFMIGNSKLLELTTFISLFIFSLLHNSWNRYYDASYQSAINNKPDTILGENILPYHKISLFDKISSLLMVYFIFIIRLFPFYKIPLSLEEIKWNRF